MKDYEKDYLENLKNLLCRAGNNHYNLHQVEGQLEIIEKIYQLRRKEYEILNKTVDVLEEANNIKIYPRFGEKNTTTDQEKETK